MTDSQIATKLTAEIIVDTVAFLAKKFNTTVEETFANILSGGNAKKHFDELMQAASNSLDAMPS